MDGSLQSSGDGGLESSKPFLSEPSEESDGYALDNVGRDHKFHRPKSKHATKVGGVRKGIVNLIRRVTLKLIILEEPGQRKRHSDEIHLDY